MTGHEPKPSAVRYLAKSIASLTVLVIVCAHADTKLNEPRPDGCLYAVTHGPDAVKARLPCGDDDPLSISNHEGIKAVISMMDLDGASVRFKGCETGLFSARSDHTMDGGRGYVVTYSSEVQDFLAPSIHELAHVLQMEIAGGLSSLWRELGDSKRIELGADFLTGIVYARLMEHSAHYSAGQFQNSLTLVGLYYESSFSAAHGSHEQRTAAFRRGLIRGNSSSDFREEHQLFQDDIYGEIEHF